MIDASTVNTVACYMCVQCVSFCTTGTYQRIDTQDIMLADDSSQL